MKVDNITLPPPPLAIGDCDSPNGDGFKLLLKRYSGSERLACIDAFTSGSFEAMHRAVGRLVAGWENVTGPDGRAVPFETEEEGRPSAGRMKSNFDALMGVLPLAVHGDVIAAVYAFIGISEAGGAIRRSTGSELDPRPTAPPAGSGPGTASGG